MFSLPHSPKRSTAPKRPGVWNPCGWICQLSSSIWSPAYKLMSPHCTTSGSKRQDQYAGRRFLGSHCLPRSPSSSPISSLGLVCSQSPPPQWSVDCWSLFGLRHLTPYLLPCPSCWITVAETWTRRKPGARAWQLVQGCFPVWGRGT